MTPDHQALFIQTVQQALADVPAGRRPGKGVLSPAEPLDREKRLEAYTSRNHAERIRLLEQLTASAKPINLAVIPKETALDAGIAIAELVREKTPEWGTQKKVTAWNHPLINSLGLEEALAAQGIPLVVTGHGQGNPDTTRRNVLRNDIIESFIGITSADYCVAETGTLTMKTRPDQPRSVSLIPAIHVAVIRLDQLVENLTELYFRLQYDPEENAGGLTNCMTFISGPSKTGDIELVMVHGAHGPRELHLYVITGDAETL